MAGDDLNDAVVRLKAFALLISAIAFGVAIAIIKHHSLSGRGGLVGTIDEHGTLIDMRVPGEDNVHAARFEDRHDVLPHLDELDFLVGVVRTLRVRWVMEEGDEEVGLRFIKVGLEPLGHRARRSTIQIVRVEANEVNFSVVERIVSFCP